jgi:hypothetical protein
MPVNYLPGAEQTADEALFEERNELLHRNLVLEDKVSAYRILCARKVQQYRDLLADYERSAFASVLKDLARGHDLWDIVEDLPFAGFVELPYERCTGILKAMAELVTQTQEPERVCRTCRHRRHKRTGEKCNCVGGPFEGFVVALQHGCERWTSRQPPSVTSPTAGRYIAETKLKALVDAWRNVVGEEPGGPCPDCRAKCADELDELLRNQP